MNKVKRLKKSPESLKTTTKDSPLSLGLLETSKNLPESKLSPLESTSESTSNSDAAEAFKRDIEASRAQIETTEKKKGRKKLPRDANGNIIREPVAASAPLEPQVQAVPPDKAVIKGAIKMPFDLAAQNTGCRELALEEPIAESLAEQAVPVIQAFFPAMQSKWSALAIFGVSLGIVTFQKVQVYKAWEKAQQKEKPQENQVS